MKALKNNHLMLGLFAALAMNASWSLYSGMSETTIESATFASSAQNCRQTTNPNGKKTVKCSIRAKKSEGDLKKEYSYSIKIEDEQVLEGNIRDFNDTKTEAGYAAVEAFLNAGETKIPGKKVSAFKVTVRRNDCNCFHKTAVYVAGTSMADIFAAVEEQVKLDAGDSFTKDKKALAKQRKEKKEQEEKQARMDACEEDSRGESLKKKDRRSDRVACIRDRMDEIVDEDELKAFWSKNKKHVKKYLKHNDDDIDDMEEVVGEISDVLYSMDLEKQAKTAEAMLGGGIAHKQILGLAHQYHSAQQRGFYPGEEVGLTSLINSTVTRYQNDPQFMMGGGSSEFSHWSSHLSQLGRLAASNPAQILGTYTDFDSSIIATADAYRRSVGLSPQGFRNSQDRINSMTGSTMQRLSIPNGSFPQIPMPSVANPYSGNMYSGRVAGKIQRQNY